jgi:hypothetical protein
MYIKTGRTFLALAQRRHGTGWGGMNSTGLLFGSLSVLYIMDHRRRIGPEGSSVQAAWESDYIGIFGSFVLFFCVIVL